VRCHIGRVGCFGIRRGDGWLWRLGLGRRRALHLLSNQTPRKHERTTLGRRTMPASGERSFVTTRPTPDGWPSTPPHYWGMMRSGISTALRTIEWQPAQTSSTQLAAAASPRRLNHVYFDNAGAPGSIGAQSRRQPGLIIPFINRHGRPSRSAVDSHTSTGSLHLTPRSARQPRRHGLHQDFHHHPSVSLVGSRSTSKATHWGTPTTGHRRGTSRHRRRSELHRWRRSGRAMALTPVTSYWAPARPHRRIGLANLDGTVRIRRFIFWLDGRVGLASIIPRSPSPSSDR